MSGACPCEVKNRIEFLARERLVLGRPLNLDELAGAGGHHIHIRIRARIFLVGKVKDGMAVHDASGDGGQRIGENRGSTTPVVTASKGLPRIPLS